MKKTIFFAGMIVAPISMAAAKTINEDTPVQWNSTVIEQALNKSGFIGDRGAHYDVRVTHDRILAELLRRGSCSMNDAAKVCIEQCSKSDFLKNGRGASGKKCPELCNAFTKALHSVNNSFKSTGRIQIGDSGLVEKLKDGTYKVWTKDKKYYAVMTNNIKKYPNICGDFDERDIVGVVFISQSNTPIGYLGYYKTDNNIPGLCVNKVYAKNGNKCLYFGIYGHSWKWTTNSIQFDSTKNLYLDYGYSDNCDDWY